MRIVISANSERHIAVDPRMPIGYDVTPETYTCSVFRLWNEGWHVELLCAELGLNDSPSDQPWLRERVKNSDVDATSDYVVMVAD
jgi:hypothetical protein